MMTHGHWTCNKTLNPQEAVGFQYVVEGNGIYYLGKKFFTGQRGKSKGKESNWRKYMGSSKALLQMIEDKGKSKFSFHIMEEYYEVSSLAWSEIWAQAMTEALTDPRFLNQTCDRCRVKPVSGITPHHKEEIKMLKERLNG